jgi:hypothetical protein
MTQLKRWRGQKQKAKGLKEASTLLKPVSVSSVNRKLIDLGTLVVGRTLDPP